MAGRRHCCGCDIQRIARNQHLVQQWQIDSQLALQQLTITIPASRRVRGGSYLLALTRQIIFLCDFIMVVMLQGKISFSAIIKGVDKFLV